MKVYLAARFSRKDELCRYDAELSLCDIEVTSRWLWGSHDWSGTADDAIPVEVLARFAREDLEDIEASDVVIAFTEPSGAGPARSGRHFEAGYTYAIGKPLIVVGPVENVFYALPEVTVCQTWEDALQLVLNASTAGIEVLA